MYVSGGDRGANYRKGSVPEGMERRRMNHWLLHETIETNESFVFFLQISAICDDLSGRWLRFRVRCYNSIVTIKALFRHVFNGEARLELF